MANQSNLFVRWNGEVDIFEDDLILSARVDEADISELDFSILDLLLESLALDLSHINDRLIINDLKDLVGRIFGFLD